MPQMLVEAKENKRQIQDLRGGPVSQSKLAVITELELQTGELKPSILTLKAIPIVHMNIIFQLHFKHRSTFT